MLFMRICVITYCCKVVGGTWGTVLYTVRGAGSGSRDVDAWRANALYAEGRGLQVPIGLDHGNIVGTQCCDTLSRAS